eukprot:CAMPEP_0115704562 /NCGR_PEP_ID=MMETSP0272-20121206/69733_1 /TAXON_ID=71861 /ORGANISM="Scrippsiella trochoidea, Strain CCMP3099" /LENGTH=83 /DNA_ID=CAMNT_0003145571 /DNA_START=22 /DNA_END=270 /DNA_ORIENTATION=+
MTSSADLLTTRVTESRNFSVASTLLFSTSVTSAAPEAAAVAVVSRAPAAANKMVRTNAQTTQQQGRHMPQRWRRAAHQQEQLR